MTTLNFNDPTALPALFLSMAEYDTVADKMVGMIADLIEQDIPLESKQSILTEAQAVLSKVRKDSPANGTAYQYSSRAKTIFGAMVQGLIPSVGRNCAGIYSDAQKYLKALNVNWKGEPVEPKAATESTPESEVADAAQSVAIGLATAALETVEKHAAYLLESKGADYAIELIAALTALIDKPVQQAA